MGSGATNDKIGDKMTQKIFGTEGDYPILGRFYFALFSEPLYLFDLNRVF